MLSESRGKEAAGIAFSHGDALDVYKAPVPARQMLRSDGFKRLFREVGGDGENGGDGRLAFIGHSRLVTDGAREVNLNNQPVVSGGVVGIHNGIIVNHAKLWQKYPHLERKYEVDSEIIFALLREHLDHGAPLEEASQRTFSELEGAASIAALFEDRDQLLLATNNGSLYYRRANGTFVFASERYILDQLKEVPGETVHVKPGQSVVIDLPGSNRRTVIDRSPAEVATPKPPRTIDVASAKARFPYVSLRDRLRRCTRCVLPETMPFVDFDESGVCAYCRRYRRVSPHGAEALEKLVAPYRRTDGLPDCLVAVSGGRDSTYGLHYLKSVLGMNPVAYTYDWGMVTDLARRNISRICGKLGIEHILVSADIPLKRSYIRKNVEAWLARPSLGTVPLFMAGDKAYFHYLNKTREQLGVELAFLCENPLERTDFKTGFAGLAPTLHDENHATAISLRDRMKLASFYAAELARNPRYFNASMWDTAKAFFFFYLIRRDYHNLYRYIQWDEETVESTLLDIYDFERADDTKTLWRIGDGTAPFYNYIYHAIAGLTENDTFRSNQIRLGVIDRQSALDLVDRDNQPRFPSIPWYLDTIGIEKSLEEVLDIIERVPKLYG
jgi:glucosamine--fructose-6-phosphate aminotransferase (isomerizing)